MSTAPPSDPSTEAELSHGLNLPHDRASLVDHTNPETATKRIVESSPSSANGSAVVSLAPASARFYRRLDSAHSVSDRVESDRVAVDITQSPDLLEDTQTFRLDDTQIGISATDLRAAVARANQQNQVASSVSARAVSAPSATGPLDGLFYESIKRWLDIVISAVALVLLSPVLLLAAVLVKLTDGGSIFYPHTRVGERGSEFTCYKFRSMVVNADSMKSDLAFHNSHDDHRTFKIPDDPRVTWVGRWMRRTSIDELPQLWNVLRGDMSIVGPRPPVVTEVEQYTWDDMQRLAVKPGLTCIWQVSGRSRLSFPEQLELDLKYIENRSLALDLKLMVLTIPAVLSADGAY